MHQAVVKVASCVLLALVAAVVASPLEAQIDSEGRIVGGFPALAASTRHQVSVRHRSTDEARFGAGHFCGGSLINNRTVLTAAHCLVDERDKKRAASYFRIVGGSTSRIQQTADTVIRKVKRVVVHERYRAENFDNDVGLLILDEPVPATHPTLGAIPMTSVSPSTLSSCQTSGWGTTQYGVSQVTNELRAVNITVQQVALCNATNSYKGTLMPGMLCVGEFQGGRDACQGDSGGPLVCGGVLAGIVSHGTGCGEPRFPGIYADVAYYHDWILRNGAGSGFRMSAVSLVMCVLAYFFVKLRDRW
uniref:Putative trypsin-like serine protease n=1 Tax=Culex tarsalis TaxID=7177 RepID=A0A1Q3EZZ4_CULTA